ncbi:MAG: thymidine kinase [Caldiserica bacterium CG02_land_8_20_14_3_00_36_38]|nr:thymidine kinase [Caldisericota bacterium]NCQ53297.1 thymidine kinase [Caldisericota bacterium]OIP12362.1 MAG: thymidine kinase [Caldisericum sp. CG2_30_36_11]PIV55922.1 MAG: thymidine kinase [Caldiserica bacterium CG02_land_8_20_14_3_00_36_38]PIX29173.1 MAG: thymidine kinase [Caldiserica bacterium CG_4_8_14_3_um_filter_35_18]
MGDKIGKIEVITGCMFSGKSEELIRRLKRARIAKLQVQVFKPSIDTRFSNIEVVSHTGEKIQAEAVSSSIEILNKLSSTINVVGIDEAQFYDVEIIKVAREISRKGIRVILAGLDMDFRGEPFGPMGNLMAIADEVIKLHAICMVCGEEATMTQRLIEGIPAKYTDPVVLIGASERYEARCKLHHYVVSKE